LEYPFNEPVPVLAGFRPPNWGQGKKRYKGRQLYLSKFGLSVGSERRQQNELKRSQKMAGKLFSLVVRRGRNTPKRPKGYFHRAGECMNLCYTRKGTKNRGVAL